MQLVLAFTAGAIVALLASLVSLVYFRWIRDFSIKMTEIAERALSSLTREQAREARIDQLAEQIGRMDQTLGNVGAMVIKGNRTVLERQLQAGETLPGRPGTRVAWSPESAAEDLPPEGLTDTPAPNVGKSVRETAFGEPT